MKTNRNLLFYWGWLVILAVFFFWMNVLSPLALDDWHYGYIFGTDQHIQTLSDVLKSQYIHYIEHNGRFVPHFFVQLFDGILGKTAFNVVNTLMFMLLFHLLNLNFVKDKSKWYMSLTLSFLLFFLVLPEFNSCFLWMSGACNYLWATNFLLAFNLLVQQNLRQKWMLPLLFLCGLLCGWTHEGIAIGALAGFSVHIAMNNRRLTASQKVLFTGFFVGVLLLVFSPGSFQRAAHAGSIPTSTGGFVHTYLADCLYSLRHLRVFYLLIFILLILKMSKMRLGDFLRQNVVWLVAIVVSYFFGVFIKSFSHRTFFMVELCSFILILELTSRLPANGLTTWCCHLVNLLMVIVLAHVMRMSKENYKMFQEEVAQLNQGKTFIWSRRHDFYNRFTVIPYAEYRYIQDGASIVHIRNRFKNKHLTFLPAYIGKNLRRFKSNQQFFFTTPENHEYVKALRRGESVKQVFFELAPTDFASLPFYEKPFAHRRLRYTATEIESEFSVMSIEGDKYLIVPKNEAVDSRVERIRVLQ